MRVVDRDEHDEPRLGDGHEPDERRDVLAGRIAVRTRLLGGAGLAADRVTGDLRRIAGGAVLVDDVRQHLP